MGDLTFTGGCLCGAIRFSARLPEHDVSVHTCSCLTCQRHSGSLTLCWMELPKAAITWTGPDGEPARYRSSAQSSRAFCRHCGSTLGHPGRRRYPRPAARQPRRQPPPRACTHRSRLRRPPASLVAPVGQRRLSLQGKAHPTHILRRISTPCRDTTRNFGMTCSASCCATPADRYQG